MKKLMLSLVAVAMTAGLVEAQTNVLSKNAVGYVKVPMESNKVYMVSHPFVNLEDGSDLHSLTNMLSAVPNGTAVSVWNEASQTYIGYARSGRGAWDAAAQTTKVSRGSAMFVRIPANAGTNDLFLMGEVPDTTMAPTTVLSRVEGVTFVGYPYPAAVSFTGTAFAISLPPGVAVSIWDSNIQSYIGFAKNGRGVWDAGAQAYTIQPGQGFIVRSSSGANSWNEVKPYTWP